MRKVSLIMYEEKNYEVIKKLVDTNGNKKNAALKLDRSIQYINRLIAGYKKDGKAHFIHGNRGRTPIHAIPDDTRQTVLNLYPTKYYDTNCFLRTTVRFLSTNVKAPPRSRRTPMRSSPMPDSLINVANEYRKLNKTMKK